MAADVEELDLREVAHLLGKDLGEELGDAPDGSGETFAPPPGAVTVSLTLGITLGFVVWVLTVISMNSNRYNNVYVLEL
jgi:hypothetical protein